MALYRCEVKPISRGAERSCVAAAAYRAGVSLRDERQNLTHDYHHKADVLHAEIMAPSDAPDWARDRAALWNGADRAEKRKDARTAREVLVALPRELSRARQIELVRAFVAEHLTGRGLVADVAIHAPSARDGEAQPHAHILVTERAVGPDGFAAKKHGIMETAAGIEAVRAAWARQVNQELERAGIEQRVDHRSLDARRQDAVARGDEIEAVRLDRRPEPKIGPVAQAMERAGRGAEAHALREALAVRQARSMLERVTAEWRALREQAREIGRQVADQARQLALDLAPGPRLATPNAAPASPARPEAERRPVAAPPPPSPRPAQPPPTCPAPASPVVDSPQLAEVKAAVGRLIERQRASEALEAARRESARARDLNQGFHGRALNAETRARAWRRAFDRVFVDGERAHARFEREFEVQPERALATLAGKPGRFGEPRGDARWIVGKSLERRAAEERARELAAEKPRIDREVAALRDERPAWGEAAAALARAEAIELDMGRRLEGATTEEMRQALARVAKGLSDEDYGQLSGEERHHLKAARDADKRSRELASLKAAEAEKIRQAEPSPAKVQVKEPERAKPRIPERKKDRGWDR